MELVISIVSWNTKDILCNCLSSLRNYIRPEHTRVIVIDNASCDGTPEMMKDYYPEVTLIASGGNLGFGRAHNITASHSGEPYVLFLNPDTLFMESAHERMLEVMKTDPGIGAIGCRMINADGTVQPLGYQSYPSPWTELVGNLLFSGTLIPLARLLLPYQDPLKDGFVRKLYGGCLMVRRDVLDQIGWFDERFFMYAEDVDLSRRIKEAGFRLYYLSSAKVIHFGAAASAKAPGSFTTLMQCESIAGLMQKYYGSAGRFIYVVGIFLRAVSRLTILAIGKAIVGVEGQCRKATIEGSRLKHLVMLKWSLGLAHPRKPR